MNILIIVGDSLDSNSSTTFFKNTILKELNNKKNNLTVIQYSSKGLNKIKVYKKNNVKYVEGSKIRYIADYLNRSIYNRYGKKITSNSIKWKKNFPEKFINGVIKKVSGYYDLILSISHPAYSHRIAYDLIESGKITYSKWNQVWFETWFDVFDQATKSSDLIHDERKLLELGDKVFYSSPILVDNHKKLYPEYEYKMEEFSLPAYPERTIENSNLSINYLGSYNSQVRNILPFYKTVVEKGYSSTIVGDTDLKLISKNDVTVINKRISSEEALQYERSSTILIVLLNTFAQIIPGKLYKYATWDKPVLVILDGSDRVKNYIIDLFGEYNKFYFVENNMENISRGIEEIINDYNPSNYEPIPDFFPERVVDILIK